jgi:ATP-dependent DNA helicase PIF1
MSDIRMTSVDMAYGDDLNVVQEVTTEREVPCCFLSGRAGTGKTFEVKRRCEEDEHYGTLCATTGIAAVNLSAITINSLLGFFNTASMRDAFLGGHLTRKLHDLALEYEWLCVDEVSMMDGDQLDILYRAVQEANRYRDVKRPLGILLVGDFAQLPPVKARWAFEAQCWPRFADNTTLLEKVWRQDQGRFLDALNAVRAGRGAEGADILDSLHVRWHDQTDTEFDGTTILAKNDQVGRFNGIALDRVQGAKFTVTSRRWGKQRSEWGENSRTHEWGIPPTMELKLGAYVMLLANAPGFAYVNGDCGTIVENNPRYIAVQLVRTGRTELINKLVRDVSSKDKPDGWYGETIPADMDMGAYIPRPHYRGKKKLYVSGQIEFFPMRLAYASTCHKSQGLSLDRAQVDFRNPFFGANSMLYVSLSRVRTFEGLRIVGNKETFVARCKVDPKVTRWL